MSIKSGAMEQYEQYSQFQSLKQFNTHFEMWMAEHKKNFSKGELLGLKRLVRYAAKIPGVCHAKIGTILKAIHKEYNESGISRSTFKRMLGKAKKFGLLAIYETERKNGSQSSNLYVFQVFPNYEPPKEQRLDHRNKTSNFSETKKIKEQNKRQEEPAKLDHTFTNDRVPKRFIQLVGRYFNNAKTIEEYWKMAKIASYKNTCEHDTDVVLTTAIHSFKQLVRKIKSIKVKNPIAYFYGILEKKFHEIYLQNDYASIFEILKKRPIS